MTEERITRAKAVLEDMKSSSNLSEDDRLKYRQRLYNIIYHGYDIPLPGGDYNPADVERSLPEPHLFERKTFHKLF